MLSLSSACFVLAERTLPDTFALLTEHRFQRFELNHVVHPVDIEALEGLRRQFGFSISSLHNVCSSLQEPLAPDNRYGDNIAALDEDQRRQSAMHLRSTAEAAVAVGASAIVVHAGYSPAAEVDPGYRALMRRLHRGDAVDGRVRQEMRDRFHARKALAGPHLAQLIRSLREVCPDFPTIRFGLECRYHFHGFPDIDEMSQVLDELALPNVGYWHDCGHAQVQENLGLGRHEEWLRRYAGRLVGVHLHGLRGPIGDHYAPTPDNGPFDMVAGYLRPDTVLVLELSRENSLHDMVAGREYIEGVLARRPADKPGASH